MIKAFFPWMRESGPAAVAFWAIVGGAILTWIVSSLFALSLKLTIANSLSYAEVINALSFYPVCLGTIVLGAGIYRAIACHPLARREYGTWLAQTPWQYPQALPLGPVHLTWQDAAVVATTAIVASLPPTNLRLIFGLPWLYPLAYAAVLCMIHWFAGLRWPAVVAVLLVGAVILQPSSLVIAVSVVIIIAIGSRTIGTVLWNFPYDEPRRRELGLSPFVSPTKTDVHWLAVPETTRRWYHYIGAWEAFVGAATIGWIMFALAAANPKEQDTLQMWDRFIALFAIACRMGFYGVEHLPPISLLGRWKWKRLIVPGYDVVFIAPIVSGLAALLLPGILVRFGVSPLVAVPIAMSTTIWLAAALPPTWETWHYTGHHRWSLGALIDSKTEVRT